MELHHQTSPRAKAKLICLFIYGALVSGHRERYYNYYIPADHPNVKQVHHPQPLSDSQHQEHSNRLAEYNTAHSAEENS